jgi:hypothetical protein
MPLKEALGYPSRAMILGSGWELLVTPEYDDARPLPVSDEFVDLETDKGILSHPLDFLTQSGVAIEKLALQVDVNGNNVRLVVQGARQASDIRPGEHCAALSLGHFLDYHGNLTQRDEDLPTNQTRVVGFTPRLALRRPSCFESAPEPLYDVGGFGAQPTL